jgi:replication factor C small subunit
MFMSNLKEEIENQVWVNKYKPKTIDDVLIDRHIKEKFKEYIEKKEIQNLIFEGNSGNGKTSCAKILAYSISKDVMFINASDESGVDIVRNKIIPFCTTMSASSMFDEEADPRSDMKIIILDEMEMSSERFQTALRGVIEDFYSTTRFIMTCNFYNKVIEPLKSRTQDFKFGDIQQVDILKRCFYILDQEKVSYDKKNVAKVLKHLGTDMRRIINTLQRLTNETQSGLVLQPYTSDEEKMLKLIELVREKKLTDVRKFIGEENMNAEQVATFLFNRAFEKKFGTENWVEQIVVVGECIDRLKTSVNPEITLIHHILQLMQLLPRR